MAPVLATVLEQQMERLPDSRRAQARREASRLVEETGAEPEAALARAVFDLQAPDERPFRRNGLRWDE